jgi:hypothetical protein
MNAASESIVRDAGQLSEEDRSKDEFFVKLAQVAEAMIDAHGKDFAMGALVLTARFIAEGKPLTNRKPDERRSERATNDPEQSVTRRKKP